MRGKSAERFWLTLLLSAGAVGYGGYEATKVLRFLAIAQHATGTVASVDDDSVSGLGRPVTIRFEDPTGAQHTFQKRIRRRQWDWRVGESVAVLYQPANPAATARHDRTIDLWAWPGAWLIIGAAGTLSAFSSRRPRADAG